MDQGAEHLGRRERAAAHGRREEDGEQQREQRHRHQAQAAAGVRGVMGASPLVRGRPGSRVRQSWA
ncbi:hypothetical protein ACWGLP_23195 [Streptomyces lydicus]